jgi:hypothetical protein
MDRTWILRSVVKLGFKGKSLWVRMKWFSQTLEHTKKTGKS